MDAESLVTALVHLQLVASAAILVVLLLRPLALRWCGAGTAYLLWLVVPLAAMAVLLPARAQVLVNPGSLDIPILQQPVEPDLDVGVTREHAATAPAVQPGIPNGGSRSGLLITLWLLGAGVFLIRSIVTTRRLSSGSLIGPALVGVLRPRLVLPHDFETRFSAEERTLILAHEELHRVSRHTLVNALVEVARCASWFNPLLHWAAMRFRADQELACDTAVITAYPEARRTYAEALLKAQVAGVYLPMGCAWTSGTAGRLAERIARLSEQLPGRRRRFAGAASIVGIGIAASYAAWAQQPARIITVQQPNPESAAVAAAETPAFEAPAAVTAPTKQTPVRTPTAQAAQGAVSAAVERDPGTPAITGSSGIQDEDQLRMLARVMGLGDAKGVVDESAMQLMRGGDSRKIAQAGLENRRQLFKDPEYRKNFRASARMTIKMENQGIARELGLSEDEAERLFDLLADNQVARAAEGSVFGGPVVEQERQEVLRTQREFDRVEEESIQALLGDKYAQWHAFHESRVARTYANAVVSIVSFELAQAGKPLTAAQNKALKTALIAEAQRQAQERRTLAANPPGQTQTMEENHSLVDWIAPHVDADQLAALREQYDRNAAGTRILLRPQTQLPQ